VVAHLGRLAQLAREDEAFWKAMIAERLRTLARWEQSETRPKTRSSNDADAGEIVETRIARRGIRCADLLAPFPWMDAAGPGEMRLAVTRRLVRGIIEEVQGHCQEITSQHVEQVLQLATRSSSGQRTSLPGIVVERSFDWLWFAKASAAEAGASRESAPMTGRDVARGAKSRNAGAFSHVITLGVAGDCAVVAITEIGRCFRLKVIDWPVAESENISVLDRDLLRPPLVLRNWRPGDSFRPQGRRSVHKLKYFLLRHRVEARERASWPVLTSAGALVWARGMPVAADVAPGPSTRTGVVIAEEEI
jgi:tRNA(Ile)-lysidine synthetase-like protein